MWERGLKLILSPQKRYTTNVAPHVGAWIETSFAVGGELLAALAPHVGARIETQHV